MWQWLALCVLCVVDARRLALVNTGSPFLMPVGETNNVVWEAADMARMVHTSVLIEVSARGIRSLQSSQYLMPPDPAFSSSACVASPGSLCTVATGEGAIFPSASPNPTMLPVTSDAASLQCPVLQNVVASGACTKGGGSGRTVANGTYYTVTACDVMLGTHVMVYRPGEATVELHAHTFGPMAYLVVLLSAVISVVGVATSNKADHTTALFACNAICSLVTTLVIILTQNIFHSYLDIVAFAVTTLMGLTYAILSLCYGGWGVMGACLHTLEALSAALYRTAETPYAGILCTVFAVRLWTKVFNLSVHGPHLHSHTEQQALWRFDLNAAIVHLCLLAEAGVRPQCEHHQDWPIYAVTGLYITYSIARHGQKHHS